MLGHSDVDWTSATAAAEPTCRSPPHNYPAVLKASEGRANFLALGHMTKAMDSFLGTPVGTHTDGRGWVPPLGLGEAWRTLGGAWQGRVLDARCLGPFTLLACTLGLGLLTPAPGQNIFARDP